MDGQGRVSGEQRRRPHMGVGLRQQQEAGQAALGGTLQLGGRGQGAPCALRILRASSENEGCLPWEKRSRESRMGSGRP